MDDRPGKSNLVVCATASSHIALLPAHLRLIKSSLPVDIQVVMTSSAACMLPPRTLEICGIKVWTDKDEVLDDGRPVHVALVRWLDVALLLPATANSIGKIANGLCDGLARLTFIGAHGAVRAIAPAMNECLWSASSVQRNVRALCQEGIDLISPNGVQPFADGNVGMGLSPTPKRVLDYLSGVVGARSADGACGQVSGASPTAR
jgi:phosphopantothenoylcysteine decarboxylase/phosphopantothenate--cysteine ligase